MIFACIIAFNGVSQKLHTIFSGSYISVYTELFILETLLQKEIKIPSSFFFFKRFGVQVKLMLDDFDLYPLRSKFLDAWAKTGKENSEF